MFPDPSPQRNITPDIKKEDLEDKPDPVAEEYGKINEQGSTSKDNPEDLALYLSYEGRIVAITTRPSDLPPLGICVGEISSNTRFDVIPAPDHVHGGWQWKESPHFLRFKSMLADEPKVPYPARSPLCKVKGSRALRTHPNDGEEGKLYGPFEILNSFLAELIPTQKVTPTNGFKESTWIIKFTIFPHRYDGIIPDYDPEDWYNLSRGTVFPERFRRFFPNNQHWSHYEWYPAILLGVRQEVIDRQPGIIFRVKEFCRVFKVAMRCLPMLPPRKK